MPTKIAIFWFRRDLRLEDNAGLYQALKGGLPVLPLFIFDPAILDKLSDKSDARVNFIHDCISSLHAELAAFGSSLLVQYGTVEEVWIKLLNQYEVQEVYTNHDYEPYATTRDEAIRQLCASKGVGFQSFKDQVIFEKSELLSGAGTPYTVFTPYSKKWLATLTPAHLAAYDTSTFQSNYYKTEPLSIIALGDMGFQPSIIPIPKKEVANSLIEKYDEFRNFPALPATSRLGIHLRFGTVSIRALAIKAKSLNATFLNELIWRDFYQMLLFQFPHSAKSAFRPEYDHVAWRYDTAEFEAWCQGKTGYPIVDAGMRELNATGFMHNRVRMIAASFLCKSLLMDWRLGEAYFASKLLDFDLASNVGGWQWAASSGADAAPYFRIFNPSLQQEKFDKGYKYIKQWVPEFNTARYPLPIVDHAFARGRALVAYELAVKKPKKD